MSCEEFIQALSVARHPSPLLNAHALRCRGCAALWRADRELRAQPQARRVPTLPPELQRELAGYRGPTIASSTPKRAFTLLMICMLATASGFLWLRRADLDLHTAALGVFWYGFSALSLALVAGLQLYLYRGRSGLGAPAWTRWAFAASAWAGFELWAALYARGSVVSGVVQHTRAAPDCLPIALLVAIAVGVPTFAVARRTALIAPAATGALGGCVAGLAAALFLHAHCPSTDAAHLQTVHALPLLLAIGLGALAGRRWLSA